MFHFRKNPVIFSVTSTKKPNDEYQIKDSAMRLITMMGSIYFRICLGYLGFCIAQHYGHTNIMVYVKLESDTNRSFEKKPILPDDNLFFSSPLPQKS